jgi:septum formation protein
VAEDRGQDEPHESHGPDDLGVLPIVPVLLASSSPRRRQLLASLGFTFDVRAASIDESLRPGENPFDAAERLARAKAVSVSSGEGDALVVAADTLVVLDGQALGKPASREDAARMLRALAGRRHEVVTGLALSLGGRMVSGREVAEVVFAPMSDEEIRAYAATGEPDDKAGAYALQGLGGLFVERIEGSPSNVVGLPVRLFYRLAAALGVSLLRPEEG